MECESDWRIMRVEIKARNESKLDLFPMRSMGYYTLSKCLFVKPTDCLSSRRPSPSLLRLLGDFVWELKAKRTECQWDECVHSNPDQVFHVLSVFFFFKPSSVALHRLKLRDVELGSSGGGIADLKILSCHARDDSFSLALPSAVWSGSASRTDLHRSSRSVDPLARRAIWLMTLPVLNTNSIQMSLCGGMQMSYGSNQLPVRAFLDLFFCRVCPPDIKKCREDVVEHSMTHIGR